MKNKFISQHFFITFLSIYIFVVKGNNLLFDAEFSSIISRNCTFEIKQSKISKESELHILSINEDSTTENNLFQPQTTDRVVAVDNLPISLQSFDEILNSPPGTKAILPIMNDYDSLVSGQEKETCNQAGSIIKGFVKVEVLYINKITLAPSMDERITKIQEYYKAKDEEDTKKRLQEEEKKLKETRERERIFEEEKKKLEADLEEKKRKREEEEEQKRLKKMREEEIERANELERKEKEANGIIPHDQIQKKRQLGEEFKYEAKFTTSSGPIGIHWDLSINDKTLVNSLEIDLPAFHLRIIQSGDQLIGINGQDVSNLGPTESTQIFLKTPIPRLLMFYSSAAKNSKPNKEDEDEDFENSSLRCVYPFLLSQVSFKLKVAPWSAKISKDSMCQLRWLTLSDPIDACKELKIPSPIQVKEIQNSDKFPRTFISYRGTCTFTNKAKRVEALNGKELVLINNRGGDSKFHEAPNQREKVNIPVTMLDKMDGDFLLSIIETQPALCSIASDWCPDFRYDGIDLEKVMASHVEYVTTKDKDKGIIIVWRLQPSPIETQYETITFIQAMFGGPLSYSPYRLVVSDPFFTACDFSRVRVNALGAVLLVGRGDCPFTDKARVAQLIGAIGIIIVNTDPDPIPLNANPGEGDDLTIWVLTVGKSSGQQMKEMVKNASPQQTFIRLQAVAN